MMLYYSTDDRDAFEVEASKASVDGSRVPSDLLGNPLEVLKRGKESSRRRNTAQMESEPGWGWGVEQGISWPHGVLLNLNLTSAHFLLCDEECRKGSLLHRNVSSGDF